MLQCDGKPVDDDPASVSGAARQSVAGPARRSRRDLTVPQTARTLRVALGAFAAASAPDEEAGGPALAGCIRKASLRARATRDLIARRRFRLAFQPVVRLTGGECHHVEALLRPASLPGQAAPTTHDFVTFSEAIGLAEELDGAVLDDVAALIASGPGPAIAVNVSGLSLQSRSFRHRLIALGVMHPGRLLIELTETAEIDDTAMVAATIDKLRATGMAVCIDDFGAGNAAFRYLREFRVDFVKIDGSFVQGAASSARDRGFVASMLELSRSVGARAIAEMIETEEQAAIMQAMGVEFGQGWLFGRPAPLHACGTSPRI
jgi:EAL domain-containing protein (putative c-di-GMP-specific phosphodiesterase class I)